MSLYPWWINWYVLLAPGIEGSDDEALDTSGQDEEVNRWEQEQIRKGISIPQVRLPDDTLSDNTLPDNTLSDNTLPDNTLT